MSLMLCCGPNSLVINSVWLIWCTLAPSDLSTLALCDRSTLGLSGPSRGFTASVVPSHTGGLIQTRNMQGLTTVEHADVTIFKGKAGE